MKSLTPISCDLDLDALMPTAQAWTKTHHLGFGWYDLYLHEAFVEDPWTDSSPPNGRIEHPFDPRMPPIRYPEAHRGKDSEAPCRVRLELDEHGYVRETILDACHSDFGAEVIRGMQVVHVDTDETHYHLNVSFVRP